MNAAAFLVAVRRCAHGAPPVPDPLSATRRFLSASGGTAEGRALHKVIETLATGAGECDESEMWLFSAETLELVAALVEALLQSLYQDKDWCDG